MLDPTMAPNFKKLALSSSSFLATVTGLGYTGAYMFEVGYLNFYGINYQAAHVTTEVFIVAGFLAVGSLVLIPTQKGIWMELWNPNTIPNDPLWNLIFVKLRHILITTLFALPLTIYYGKWIWLLYFIIFGLIAAVTDLMIDGKGKRSIREKAKSATAASNALSESSDVGALKIAGVAGIIIIFASVALLAGKTFAYTRTAYQVLDNDHIVVRNYNGAFITAQYNPQTEKLSGKYAYMYDLDMVDFKMVSIDRIRK